MDDIDIYDETRYILSKMSQASTFGEVSDLERELRDLIKEFRKIQYKRLVYKYKRAKENKNNVNNI